MQTVSMVANMTRNRAAVRTALSLGWVQNVMCVTQRQGLVPMEARSTPRLALASVVKSRGVVRHVILAH